MKKRLLAVLLVVALVAIAAVFAVSAAPANYDLTVNGDTATGYCPHCDKNVTDWKAWVETETPAAGHYFLKDNVTVAKKATISADVVLHLNGKTYTRSVGTPFAVTGTLSIVDGAKEEGVITAAEHETEVVDGAEVGVSGGLVQINGGTVNLYAGTLKRSESATVLPANGGIAAVIDGTFNMFGGTVDGGQCSGFGGNFYLKSESIVLKSKVVMSGGKIINGYSADTTGGIFLHENADLEMSGGLIDNNSGEWSGGNICVGNMCNIYATGGTISNGYSAQSSGGNIFCNKAGSEMYFENVTITGGIGGNPEAVDAEGNPKVIDGRGGNVSIRAAGVYASFKNCTISNGKNTSATAGGANIYLESGEVDIEGGIITGGESLNSGGGNIALHGTTAKMTIKGATVSAGKAKMCGGNIMLMRNLAQLIIEEGSFIDGSQAEAPYGKNICLVKSANPAGTLTIKGGVVTSGDDTSNISVPETHKQADVYIEGGVVGAIIFEFKADEENGVLTSDTMVHIADGYKGDLTFGFRKESSLIKYEAGTKLFNSDKIEFLGAYEGNLKLVDPAGKTYPLAKTAEGLKIAGYSGVKKDAEGKVTETALADLTTAAQYDYIRVFANTEITLAADTAIEANCDGLKVNTAGKKLTLLGGTVTVDDTANVKEVAVNPATGATVVAVAGAEKAVSAHEISIKLNTVSVRPEAAKAGVYYKATITADAAVQAMMKDYGVVVSANAITENFAADAAALYTNEKFTGLASGATSFTAYSALYNVLSTETRDKTNDAYGKQAIYASAYVTLTINGKDVKVMAQNAVDASLFDIMTAINTQYAAVSAPANVVAFVKQWNAADALGTWKLDNLD